MFFFFKIFWHTKSGKQQRSQKGIVSSKIRFGIRSMPRSKVESLLYGRIAMLLIIIQLSQIFLLILPEMHLKTCNVRATEATLHQK